MSSIPNIDVVTTSDGKTPTGETITMPVTGLADYSFETLAAGETKSFEFVHVGYTGLLYVIKSDQPSATGGITIDFSFETEGENWVPAGVAITYSQVNQQIQRALHPKARRTRFHYTNGDVAQTSFSIQFILTVGNVQPTLSSLNLPLTDSVLAMITKGTLEFKNEAGSWGAINRTGGAMNVYIANDIPLNIDFPVEVFEGISTTLTSGNARVQIVDGNNQNRGTNENPFKVATPPGFVQDVSIKNNDLATDAKLDAILSALSNLQVSIANFPSLQAVSITGVPPVAVQNPVDISGLANALANILQKLGDVTVSNQIDVSGLGQQNTLLALLETINDGINVAVGNLPATQNISGNVNATIQGTPNVNANVQFPANQAVTISNPTDTSAISKEATLQAVIAKLVANPATETTLAALLTKINASIAVTAQALPLPNGASTSTMQASGNASLNNIDTDLGAQADLQATSSLGNLSVISLLKGMLQRTTVNITTVTPNTLTSVVLLPANQNRKGAILTSLLGKILVSFAPTANATNSMLSLTLGVPLEIPFGYTGVISGIGTGTNVGNVLIYEFI